MIIATCRHGSGSRSVVSCKSRLSLYSNPIDDLESCNKAGKKIEKKIYNPVSQFDSKWTCDFNGDKK